MRFSFWGAAGGRKRRSPPLGVASQPSAGDTAAPSSVVGDDRWDQFCGGQGVFSAPTLGDAAKYGHKRDWQDLIDHLVRALRWRADSSNEPQWLQRLQATRLLAQLAMPQVTIT